VQISGTMEPNLGGGPDGHVFLCFIGLVLLGKSKPETMVFTIKYRGSEVLVNFPVTLS
jgi:hypothetical protein